MKLTTIAMLLSLFSFSLASHASTETNTTTQQEHNTIAITQLPTINGISFEDWAAGAAHLTHGMPEQEIADILGVELAVWHQTMELWSNKLGDLMAEDMSIATTYGEIFANPKVGKFADHNSSVTDLDTLLLTVPNYDTYQKIFWQQSVATEYGTEAQTVLEQNGLSLQSWAQLNMHYLKWHKAYLEYDKSNPDKTLIRQKELVAIEQKWRAYWHNYYSNHKQ